MANSWLTVQKDKSFLITEERLRFPVDATVPPNMVPMAIFKDLQRAVDIFEKHRQWKLIDVVPRKNRLAFPGGKPCCADITSKKAGESLSIIFMPATYQGDTDDAHNFDALSDPDKRMYEQGIIDWVAIMHFWVPGITVDPDADADYSRALTPEQGFQTLDGLHPELQSYLKQRFTNNG